VAGNRGQRPELGGPGEGERAAAMRYCVTTIIPRENPVRRVRYMDQEELRRFLDSYDEYEEFIAEIARVPPEGE